MQRNPDSKWHKVQNLVKEAQLPGRKSKSFHAKTRSSTPYVGLISPPATNHEYIFIEEFIALIIAI